MILLGAYMITDRTDCLELVVLVIENFEYKQIRSAKIITATDSLMKMEEFQEKFV